MRIFIFSKQAGSFLLLLCSCCLFSQFIIEQNLPGVVADGTKHVYHFDENNYTKVLDENGRKTYVTTQLLDQSNIPVNEEDVNVMLSINLIFDPDQYEAPFLVGVYDESGYTTIGMWEGSNPINISVPPGNYDIYAPFSKGSANYYVIRELVDVSENSTMEIDVTEAVNHITARLYNENGELLAPGLWDPQNGTVTGGNAEILADRALIFNPYNYAISSVSYRWPAMNSENEDPMWDFYISNLSERYSITQNMVGIGYDNDNYFSKFETLSGFSGPAALENNPEDWVFHQEKFQPTLLGESQGNFYVAISTVNTWGNRLTTQRTAYTTNEVNPEEGFKAYINNPFNQDQNNLLVFPAIVDYMEFIDMPWQERLLIKGNAIMGNSNNEIIYGSGNSSYGLWYFLGPVYYATENGLLFLPFHPRFSFSLTENSDIRQGSNSPVSVTAVVGNYISTQYKGRYGEVRESDFFNTGVEIKQNGETVFSGNYVNDFLQFQMPEGGILDITLTNLNVEVGGVAGKNITQVLFNLSQDDSTPPTLQMLQFRNTDDKVTEQFTYASEGTVRLAAGDFLHDVNTNSFTYQGGNNVEFYYSLYTQDDWTELELTEYPEYFQMPAFGDYYEASLENVVVPEENSWFDVKIICTDAAGNKQEQIVSPAFKIGEINMGVEETDKSGFVVYPNPFSGELNVQLPENVKGSYTFKVTDLSGKIVYAQSQNDKSFVWNGSSLPKGIYILSIENNGKVMAKKVIRK